MTFCPSRPKLFLRLCAAGIAPQCVHCDLHFYTGRGSHIPPDGGVIALRDLAVLGSPGGIEGQHELRKFLVKKIRAESFLPLENSEVFAFCGTGVSLSSD